MKNELVASEVVTLKLVIDYLAGKNWSGTQVGERVNFSTQLGQGYFLQLERPDLKLIRLETVFSEEGEEAFLASLSRKFKAETPTSVFFEVKANSIRLLQIITYEGGLDLFGYSRVFGRFVSTVEKMERYLRRETLPNSSRYFQDISYRQ